MKKVAFISILFIFIFGFFKNFYAADLGNPTQVWYKNYVEELTKTQKSALIKYIYIFFLFKNFSREKVMTHIKEKFDLNEKIANALDEMDLIATHLELDNMMTSISLNNQISKIK